MDYYASWPAWKMPKWLGATLGGIFTLIVVVCVGLIVDLTRPPHRATAAVAAAVAGPARPAPAVKTVAPVEKTMAPVVAQQSPAAAKKTHDPSRAMKHSILAKRDSKANRQSNSELDRLLGL